MKRTTVFFLCFLFSASLSNAQILVKKERMASGKIHYSFSNANVNIDSYDDEVASRSMSAAEKEQADRIEREKQAMRNREEANRQAKAMAEQRVKEERARNRPIIVPAPVVNIW